MTAEFKARLIKALQQAHRDARSRESQEEAGELAMLLAAEDAPPVPEASAPHDGPVPPDTAGPPPPTANPFELAESVQKSTAEAQEKALAAANAGTVPSGAAQAQMDDGQQRAALAATSGNVPEVP